MQQHFQVKEQVGTLAKEILVVFSDGSQRHFKPFFTDLLRHFFDAARIKLRGVAAIAAASDACANHLFQFRQKCDVCDGGCGLPREACVGPFMASRAFGPRQYQYGVTVTVTVTECSRLPVPPA